MTTGTGNVANFQLSNSSNSADAVQVNTNGTGRGLSVVTTGTGTAGYFSISNTATANAAVYASTNGSASAGVYAKSTSSNSIELDGPMKVSGSRPTAFQITVPGVSANYTIPNTSVANAATDLVIVTAAATVTTGFYVTWNGSSWVIYPTSGTIPANTKFNVMVIKQ
jgi:hypothetical protein